MLSRRLQVIRILGGLYQFVICKNTSIKCKSKEPSLEKHYYSEFLPQIISSLYVLPNAGIFEMLLVPFSGPELTFIDPDMKAKKQ